ncbi:hypothetical protein E2C01_001800 [Portunus trituberculatus]|uniref:Uncharacterized protein n=1 Tax=Portunus trituberculatus TaxID=210409 RepID=A0A5B7CLB1_PORTR|nr:hypothetical protein [Portunus trituberculatus]
MRSRLIISLPTSPRCRMSADIAGGHHPSLGGSRLPRGATLLLTAAVPPPRTTQGARLKWFLGVVCSWEWFAVVYRTEEAGGSNKKAVQLRGERIGELVLSLEQGKAERSEAEWERSIHVGC